MCQQRPFRSQHGKTDTHTHTHTHTHTRWGTVKDVGKHNYVTIMAFMRWWCGGICLYLKQSVCCYFLRLYILEQFQVHSKTERKIQRFPAPIHSQTFPLSTSLMSEVFVRINEPTLTHHNHSQSIVYLRVHSWCCTFYGFGQMYNDMYLPLQYCTEQIHCPKHPLCSLPVHPSLPPHPPHR